MRTITVGDIHGCWDEFRRLLDTVKYEPGKDYLVSVGDLVDRGPEPVKVVSFFKETPNTAVVLGNHEENHVRYWKHETEHALHLDYKIPMSLSEYRLSEHRSFAQCDFLWMSKLPRYLRLRPDLAVVHAGVRPGVPLEEQKPGDLTHIRFVDAKGKPKALDKRLGQPEGTVYWTEQYYGGDHVVYGHNAASLTQVRFHVTPVGKVCVGLDTGACFGGKLSAFVLEEGQPVSEGQCFEVQASRAYAEWHPPRE